MKYLLISIAALGLLGSGGMYMGLRMYRAKMAAAAAAAEPAVEVRRGSISQSVSSTGKVVANLDVDIKCRASGEVIKLPFDVSQKVKKGDLLLELDTVDEIRAVTRAKAVVAQSEAKWHQAQKNLEVAEQAVVTTKARAAAAIHSAEVKAKSTRLKADRRKQLVDEKLGSTEDLEAAEIDAAAALADLETAKVSAQEAVTQEVALELKRQDVAVAKAMLDSDQIALDDANQQLAYTKVYAPMDGVVSALDVQVGTVISSAITNIGGGSTILTLSDLNRNHIFVLASVDEADIVKVALNQKVIITADAVPDRQFVGKVVRIATKGTNVSNVVTFEVKIELTGDTEDLLKPEMTANLQVISAEHADAMIVPANAVIREKGKDWITVVKPGGIRDKRAVQTGLTDDENTEILGGVSLGDKIELQTDQISKFSNEKPEKPERPEPKNDSKGDQKKSSSGK